MVGLISRNVASSLTLRKTPLLLLYPATWFGAYLELASGQAWDSLEIVPAAASVFALGAMASMLGSRLSLEYSERLSALTTAVAPGRAAAGRDLGRQRDRGQAAGQIIRVHRAGSSPGKHVRWRCSCAVSFATISGFAWASWPSCR